MVIRVLLFILFAASLQAQDLSKEQVRFGLTFEKAKVEIAGINKTLDKLYEEVKATKGADGQFVIPQDNINFEALKEIPKQQLLLKEKIASLGADLIEDMVDVYEQEGVAYYKETRSDATRGDMPVLMITPEGEHRINRFAAFLKSMDVKLCYNPQLLFHDNSAASFLPSARVLNMAHMDAAGINKNKQNNIHEMIHSFFNTLWAMGIESDLMGVISAKTGVISQTYAGKYNDNLWLDEIAAYLENMSSNARSAKREFKKARGVFNNYAFGAELVLKDYFEGAEYKALGETERTRLAKLGSDVNKILETFPISSKYSPSRHQKLMEKINEIFGSSDSFYKREFLDFLQDMYNRDLPKEITVNSSERLELKDLDNLVGATRKNLLSMNFELETVTNIILRIEEVFSRINEKIQGEYSSTEPTSEDYDGLYAFDGLSVGYKYFSNASKGIYYYELYYLIDNLKYKTTLSIENLKSDDEIIAAAKDKITRQMALIKKFKEKVAEIRELLDKDAVYKKERKFLFNDESADLDALAAKIKEAHSLYKDNISLTGKSWGDVIKGYQTLTGKTKAVSADVTQTDDKKVPPAKIDFTIKGLASRIKALNAFLDTRFGVGYNKYDKYPVYMNGVEGMALVSEDGGVVIILDGKGKGIDIDFKKLPQKVLDKIESEQFDRKRVPFEILNDANRVNDDGGLLGYLSMDDNEIVKYAVIATLSGTERNTIEEMLYNTLTGTDAERIMPDGDLYAGYDKFIAQKDIRASLIKYVGMDSSSDKYLAKNFFRKMYEDLEANDGVLSTETLSYLTQEDVLGFLGTNAPWNDASVLIASIKDLLVIVDGKYDAEYAMKKVEMEKLRQDLKERFDINLLKK
jgi:hypothetical protein